METQVAIWFTNSLKSVFLNCTSKTGGAPIIEGSLEVKLPTIWTDGKAEVGRVRERQRVRRKKMQVREKVGKPRNTAFFDDLWAC